MKREEKFIFFASRTGACHATRQRACNSTSTSAVSGCALKESRNCGSQCSCWAQRSAKPAQFRMWMIGSEEQQSSPGALTLALLELCLGEQLLWEEHFGGNQAPRKEGSELNPLHLPSTRLVLEIHLPHPLFFPPTTPPPPSSVLRASCIGTVCLAALQKWLETTRNSGEVVNNASHNEKCAGDKAAVSWVFSFWSYVRLMLHWIPAVHSLVPFKNEFREWPCMA